MNSLQSLRLPSINAEARRWNALLDEVQRRTISTVFPLHSEIAAATGTVLSLAGGPGIARAGLSFQPGDIEGLMMGFGGGIVWWHGVPIVIPAVSRQDNPIVIPANSSAFKVWLQVGDECMDYATAAGGSEVISFEWGPNGWEDQGDGLTAAYPLQPRWPAVKYRLLCEVDSSEKEISEIRLTWKGGDMEWDNSFAVYG